MSTKSRTPEEIAVELAPAYDEWKHGETEKEKLKKEFFDAITWQVEEDEELEEDYLLVTAATAEEAVELCEQQRPGFNIEDYRKAEDIEDAWEFILVANPEYVTYAVEHDGRVWKKSVSEGDSMLDDERLKAENEELWFAVTEFPNEDFILDLVYESGVDPELVEDHISRVAARHGLTRILKDAKDISDEDMAELQKYTYTGKPKIRFNAPTKVKEAEVG